MADKTLEQRFEELERRVKVYEDIEQIRELQTDYMNAHIFGDRAGEIACFTEDGVLVIHDGVSDIVLKGRDVVKLAEGPDAKEGEKVESNVTEVGIVVHPKITVNGDEATGKWVNYNVIALNSTKQPTALMQANFDCKYVRKNGEWKIKHMEWTLLFGPTPPETPPELTAGSN